jgi:DNA-binding MarR family transcriptional regulator
MKTHAGDVRLISMLPNRMTRYHTRPPPSLHVTAFRAFVRASGLFRNVMTPYFAQFGLSGSQWGVLRALDRAESEGHDRLRLTDLGRRLLVRVPSVSGVVDRLARLGLVKRVRATTDRREKRVVLTRAGRKLVRRVLRRHPAQIRKILGGLDRGEVVLLRRLMERIAAHLEPLADAHDDTADDSNAEQDTVDKT